MAKNISVRLDDKGRLTLPKSIRDALQAKPGDVFYLQPENDGLLIIKGENPFGALAGQAAQEYEDGQTKEE